MSSKIGAIHFSFGAILSVVAACTFAFTSGPIAAAPVGDSLVPSLDLYLKAQTVATLPDGRKVNFLCMGEGNPIAIIEQGWGGVPFQWKHVQPKMAAYTKVCYFERPGYGFSDPGPMPRDSAADVRDLHNALQAAGLKPPYILVSASLGGFNIRLYAYTYPSEVAGLEIQDPPAEQIYVHDPDPDENVDGLRRCIAIAKVKPLTDGGPEHCIRSSDYGQGWPDAMRAKTFADNSRVTFLETLLSEDLSMVDQSTKEIIAARRPLGHIPLVILQADTDCDWEKRTPQSPGERADFARCAALANEASDSTIGERRIVRGSKHSIYDYKPEVVVATFREIIAVARKSKATAADN